MPNWIEGVLKIRGDREHLLKFLNEGLDAVEGGSSSDWKITDYDDTNEIYVQIRSAHIVGSHRGFFENTSDEIFFDDDEISIMCLDAQFAWNVDVDALVALSKACGVDFRFYGFERGMQFNREIEILQGQLTEDRTITFDDYEWECIDPKKGG